uniref:nicotinate phosphoribosyltransferase n=1 Tax=Thermodesulfovibrio aggregans TaxID=86166 RepID=A0A7C4AK64_9BACT
MFHIANYDEIIKGKVTDVYFERTLKILKQKGINPSVKAEVVAKSFPAEWRWAVFAGLHEALELLKNLPVKVRAIPEGSIFYPFEPVIEIEGRYQDFCIYETALLGFLCQATGIATKAARLRRLAQDKIIISFGARRMHPAIAPMIERAAYIGGCDGVATVIAAELTGLKPSGTMPHALILCMGSTVDAARAFDEVIEKDVPRIVLIDTFQDEKFECINVAMAMGEKIFGVRFDTPSSRKGNFYQLLKECRWELDIRGFKNIKIFVSGGIDEEHILQLNEVVDGYGIGTAISNAPTIDFSLDIVEIEGRQIAKRGKLSGSKKVFRCNKCLKGEVVFYNEELELKECSCGGMFQEILKPVNYDEIPTVHEIRTKVLEQIRNIIL